MMIAVLFTNNMFNVFVWSQFLQKFTGINIKFENLHLENTFTLKNSKNNVKYFFVKHLILISSHFVIVIVGWILDIDTCNVILVVHVMVIVQVS